MVKSEGKTAASGKNVTAIVITTLLFLSPPAKISDVPFSVLHFPITPFNFASRKPVIVNIMHKAAVIHETGSVKLIADATAEVLAAITRKRQIFANGSTAGHITSGIFLLLNSFIATATIVGTTTIRKRERIIPLISIETFAPIKTERVTGTTRGASIVSSRIKVRASALSPLKTETQINPETAVGPANINTNPVIISGLEIISEEDNNAANGIIIWLVIKKSKIGRGFFTAAPNSEAVSFKAPEKVITAKRTITKGRRFIKTPGRNKPSATARGVVTGIKRFN
jgi:hypothetical protein